MSLWFSENYADGVVFSIKVNKQLASVKSEFQQIDVYDSDDLGRILVIDDYLMLTEKDEFIYHEMLVHVPMAVHPKVEQILVIGAGDGGIVRELTRYDYVKKIDLVEIDEMVIKVCREFFPQIASKFDDARVNIHIQDGLEYVKYCQNQYDLIIVDSTDPVGPGEALFTEDFYRNCYKALKDDGIMVNQHESPFYPIDVAGMKKAHKKIYRVFDISEVYQAHIPTYASGHWLFGFASKKYHPTRDFNADRWNSLGIKTKYYNTDLHIGAFALPNYVKELLKEAENEV
ncbi:spermidine synthase SpeE [Thermoclostridium stercorarium subsp. stercorarium DSM 8532]|jgi:spermidine synthase|uniref:Polyamine aminopropyltransferase n=3 Tax=Thermoclostridium stercorarium TaxID=1510 RepID=L7VM45_THES1|nr:polyamine aminopropyltransferase [Thermoclostridium stercorarium]AGC69285.1 spermidine synthase SpeE [Thermoclostridium stercorarium subsp. stercorarium DSM 8532]AGI40250.1 spermidine synthase [Thermoclostridium stercorarium subsp. stercorarium DSM 8532]ANW99552.1 spermidine synthase [Thermoclostridium stercorarium subsp. thermolacticum DSM 2910]ANX02179.1 spermidine synthase [Thermoclostridium stercorarium subsp. leptospartum DSM 9219]